MWFLNKLGAVLSTENWIFCITYPDYIFIKNWKNGYAVKKKTNKKTQKEYMTENLWLWWCCSYTTVHLCFKNCKALRRTGNAGMRCLFSLGGCAVLPKTMIAVTIPFFYLKWSHFEKLLHDNYQNTEYRQKGVM